VAGVRSIVSRLALVSSLLCIASSCHDRAAALRGDGTVGTDGESVGLADAGADNGQTCPDLVAGNILSLQQQDFEDKAGPLQWRDLQNPTGAIRVQWTGRAGSSGCAALEVEVKRAVPFIQLSAIGPLDEVGTFALLSSTDYVLSAMVQSLQDAERFASMAVDLFSCGDQTCLRGSWISDHRQGDNVELLAGWTRPTLTFSSNSDTLYAQAYLQIHDRNWQQLAAGERYLIDFSLFIEGEQLPSPRCGCP
jgi:hypothetical protein